jgi:hypothetical protein
MRIRSIDDVLRRYRENWRGYVRQFGVLLVVTLVAALADAASTIYFMLIDGPGAETHPAVRLVASLLGPVLGPLVGKAIQFFVVIAVTVYLRRHALYIFVSRNHPVYVGRLVQHLGSRSVLPAPAPMARPAVILMLCLAKRTRIAR